VLANDFWSNSKSGGRGHEEILLSHFARRLNRKSFRRAQQLMFESAEVRGYTVHK
jgi:hypothetical protein